MAPSKTKTFAQSVRTFLLEEYYKILLWWKLYGPKSILLQLFACSNTWCMVQHLLSRYGKDSLEDSKGAFKDFRDLQTSECNAVAVSGTLIATMGIASMALPSANQAHWTARAFWVLSLVSGLISVQHACNLQCTLTKNLSCDKLFGWLNDERKRKVNEKYKKKVTAAMDERENNNSKVNPVRKDEEKGIRCNCMPFAKAETNSTNCKSERDKYFHIPDLFAVLLISAPRIMLHYSLLAYTVGLGIYLGVVWKEQLVTEAAVGDNQSIFMFFVASIAVCYPMYWLYFVANLCKNDAYRLHWEQVWAAEEVGITEALHKQVIC